MDTEKIVESLADDLPEEDLSRVRYQFELLHRFTLGRCVPLKETCKMCDEGTVSVSACQPYFSWDGAWKTRISSGCTHCDFGFGSTRDAYSQNEIVAPVNNTTC